MLEVACNVCVDLGKDSMVSEMENVPIDASAVIVALGSLETPLEASFDDTASSVVGLGCVEGSTEKL